MIAPQIEAAEPLGARAEGLRLGDPRGHHPGVQRPSRPRSRLRPRGPGALTPRQGRTGQGPLRRRRPPRPPLDGHRFLNCSPPGRVEPTKGRRRKATALLCPRGRNTSSPPASQRAGELAPGAERDAAVSSTARAGCGRGRDGRECGRGHRSVRGRRGEFALPRAIRGFLRTHRWRRNEGAGSVTKTHGTSRSRGSSSGVANLPFVACSRIGVQATNGTPRLPAKGAGTQCGPVTFLADP